MSSRSTVLDTPDEHWFTDCNIEVHDGVTYSDVLTIHIDKKNVLVFQEDANSYVLDINPNSDLYKQLVQKLAR
jgi:hypothetical protein